MRYSSAVCLLFAFLLSACDRPAAPPPPPAETSAPASAPAPPDAPVPPPTTVQDVLASSADDDLVTLRGRLVRALGAEEYLFADDTGEIQVEIGEALLRREDFVVNRSVEIYGEVEKDQDRVEEIDVRRLTDL